MIKLKVSVASLALIGMIGYGVHSLRGSTGVEVDGNKIELTTQYDEDSMDRVMEGLKDINETKGPTERALLTITSPGGSVFDGRKMFSKMKAGVPVDTYVPTFAASMGADNFMLGKRRYIEPDARIIFHGSFSGGSYFNAESTLKMKAKMIDTDLVREFYKASVEQNGSTEKPSVEIKSDGSILLPPKEKNPYFPEGSVVTAALKLGFTVDEGRAAYDVLQEALATNYATALHTIKSDYDNVMTINRTMLSSFKDAIEHSNGKLTEEIIIEKVFNNFKTDVFLTGQQAYDLGLATHLGAPNEEDYKSE